jgi:hypothetical protein
MFAKHINFYKLLKKKLDIIQIIYYTNSTVSTQNRLLKYCDGNV